VSLLVALGVRADGQKVLLAIKTMAARARRLARAARRSRPAGLPRPELVVVDGAPGLESAGALWPTWLSNAALCTSIAICSLTRRSGCTRKSRTTIKYDLPATKPEMRERKAFVRKWRLKCRAVADSLEKRATSSSPSRASAEPMKSIRTSNAIERLHEEFKRRIKTQTVLPALKPPMLFWRCSPPGRSPCARSTDGRASLKARRSDH